MNVRVDQILRLEDEMIRLQTATAEIQQRLYNLKAGLEHVPGERVCFIERGTVVPDDYTGAGADLIAQQAGLVFDTMEEAEQRLRFFTIEARLRALPFRVCYDPQELQYGLAVSTNYDSTDRVQSVVPIASADAPPYSSIAGVWFQNESDVYTATSLVGEHNIIWYHNYFTKVLVPVKML